MVITTKGINLQRILFGSAALTSMLGAVVLASSPVKAIPVRTEANLDRGTNRISVDLYRFIKREYQNYRVRPKCRGDLNRGELIIRCDVSHYTESGNGHFPFSHPQPSNSHHFRSNKKGISINFH